MQRLRPLLSPSPNQIRARGRAPEFPKVDFEEGFEDDYADLVDGDVYRSVKSVISEEGSAILEEGAELRRAGSNVSNFGDGDNVGFSPQSFD